MRVRLPVLTILLFAVAHPSLARESGDMEISYPVFATGAGRGAPFRPGETVETTVEMRNRGDAALSLRRIVIQSSPSLILLDAAEDGVDNDGDGETDGPDEGFQRQGPEGAAWRMTREGLRIEPGQTIRRTLRFRIRDDALAGTAGYVSVSAGTTLSEGARSRPQRSRRLHPVPFVPPLPTLAAEGDGEWTAGTGRVLSGSVVLPGGSVPEARVALRLSPGFGAIEARDVTLGDGIDCAEEADPVMVARGVDLALGRCRIDPQASEDARTLRLAVEAVPMDADAAGTPEEIVAWRGLSGVLSMNSGATLLAATTLGARLTGPLPLVEALPGDDARYRPGDTVTARYRLTNRGDRPLVDPVLRLINIESFECLAIGLEDGASVDCAGPVALDATLATDEIVDMTVEARLRPDALIEAETGIAMAMTGEGIDMVAYPVAPIEMGRHGNPSLEVAQVGDWSRDGAFLSATIGQGARLRIRGTLPPGRYRGDVRLLARTVDARTGAPVSPAAVDVTDARLTILTAQGETVGQAMEVVGTADTLWSQRILPFDLRGDEAGAEGARGFTADLDVQIADAPALSRDRLLELTAESTAYGDSTVSGTSWIEVLIVEPDLRPKLFSLDEGRTIQPGEPLEAVALVCNYGDAPAYRAELALAVPARLDREAAEARAIALPLEAVQTRVFEALANETEEAPDARVAMADGVMLDQGDAPLDPGACLGVELRGSLEPDRTGRSATAEVAARIAPYGGLPEEGGRVYPGAETSALRFRVPAMRFGPSATLGLDGDRLSHDVVLEAPDWLGPFRLSLSPESSTGLDWALSERFEKGDTLPWYDGATYGEGARVRLRMEADAPDASPLGWVDTSTLRATIRAEDGRSFAVALRVVSRGEAGSGDAIETSKRVARDRNCNGVLADEDAQDAVFEAGKDAASGDCLVVRIEFINAGKGEIERIVIRDRLPARTALVDGSPAIRIAPEPLDSALPPDPAGDGTLEWTFEGLFRPGAVGEVEYVLRLDPSDPSTKRPQ